MTPRRDAAKARKSPAQLSCQVKGRHSAVEVCSEEQRLGSKQRQVQGPPVDPKAGLEPRIVHLVVDWYTADCCNAAFARMPRSAAGICGSAGAAAGNPTSGSSYFDCSGYVGLISGFTRLYPSILPLGTTLIESPLNCLLLVEKCFLPVKIAYYW